VSTLRVLNVDDEPQARRAMRIALIARGFEVIDAASGEEGIEMVRAERPDVVLLDLTMPGMNGIEACRAICSFSDVPVVVVSARRSPKDRTEAFEAGADQYLEKPFDVEELVARIRAVRRRTAALRTRVIAVDGVEIDLESHEVKRNGTSLHLTAKEFKLVRYLWEHAGDVVSHRRLLQAVWGPDYGSEIEYLRVFVNQVRKKIEPDPRNPRILLTEPAVGYRFAPNSRPSGKP